MIGTALPSDETEEPVPPFVSSVDDGDQIKPDADTGADADGPPPAASTTHHPFAGLLEVAINAVSTMAADFLRERLSRILHAGNSTSDPKVPPTATNDETAPKANPHSKDGLLLMVAVAAVTTTVLWYLHEKDKK